MDPQAAELIRFLKEKILGRPDIQIQPDTPLVSSGLVDSFALVEVLHELERVTGRMIPSGRVSPRDLETVEGMLILAERTGSYP